MKFHSLYAFLVSAVFAPILLLSCSGGDEETTETPTAQYINLRSCSVADGAEYSAPDLKEITLSYGRVVSVSSSANITLNGVKCAARSGAATAMDVVVTLPALEEGKSYTLNVPEGSIVGKDDKNLVAKSFSVTFKTKEGYKPISNDATALTKRLGWGWCLGNHFDTSTGKDGEPASYGYWDNAKPTKSLYTNLKKAGVSTVRIAVTWGNYQDVNNNYAISPSYMAEVKQNVDWAEAAGLNAIINLHHDEYWLDIKGAAGNNITNDAVKNRIEKTWRQIAETFKDKGDFLLFESFNEIQDGKWGWGDNRTDGGRQYKTLNEWNQLVVDVVRSTGGNNSKRWIGVPAYASNPSFALEESFVLPSDAANRIMVSVHFYDPNTFTLAPENNDGKSEWGHTAAAGKFQAGSNEEHVVSTFSKLYEKYIMKNIPVYIGEYGCVMHNNDRSNLFRNYYLEYVCRAAYMYCMPVMLWDNNVKGGGNEHHGYFNHTDGTYLNNSEALVQMMIKAATSTDANYTLDTVYNKAPK